MRSMKEYLFSVEEMILLREAMSDYVQHLAPTPNASPQRVRNYKAAIALKEQFKNDVRLA